jgi:hypothetical protein
MKVILDTPRRHIFRKCGARRFQHLTNMDFRFHHMLGVQYLRCRTLGIF